MSGFDINIPVSYTHLDVYKRQIFKSLGRSLRQASTIEEEYADEIPSTKGVL